MKIFCVKIFKATGCVGPKGPPGRPSLHVLTGHEEMIVIRLLLESPTMEQKELCSAIQEITGTCVSIPTICRLIKKYGITRKQIQTIPVQRVIEVRAHFMSEVLTMSREMFVWLDETGCDRRDYKR